VIVIWLLDVFLIVAIPLLVEARRAARNERAQLARGGIEAGGDVYKLMRIAYPAAFGLMIAEAALRGRAAPRTFLAGLVGFALAKALKWWAIVTLGRYWTFRVIVVPGTRLVDGGPYRFLRHPNYVGVVLELLAVGLMTGAAVSAAPAVVLFSMLLKRRIVAEERALASAARHPPCSL
jgi:methyltransferase